MSWPPRLRAETVVGRQSLRIIPVCVNARSPIRASDSSGTVGEVNQAGGRGTTNAWTVVDKKQHAVSSKPTPRAEFAASVVPMALSPFAVYLAPVLSLSSALGHAPSRD